MCFRVASDILKGDNSLVEIPEEVGQLVGVLDVGFMLVSLQNLVLMTMYVWMALLRGLKSKMLGKCYT